MQPEETLAATCPYCGEPIELTVDCSMAGQPYIEDCSVCCQPIMVTLNIESDGSPSLQLKTQND